MFVEYLLGFTGALPLKVLVKQIDSNTYVLEFGAYSTSHFC